MKSIHRLIAIAAALITFSGNANSQDLMGFDRASYGSVVLSQSQSAGSDLQLELSIGNYENEPIINYSSGSVFAQIGRSVGRLDVLTDKGVFPCTAFIVSEKHILTNYHCSKGLLDNEKIGASRIDATQFVAGYTQTGIDEGTKKYTVIPTPVEASKTLDYAVLEVIGDPSQEYGQLKLASTSPAGGDPFWIIGHPMGEGQRISREKCKANNPALSAGKLLHTCDTLPGNSGSPVIDAGLQQVVALHHAGSKADSVNFAILMSEILANSKVLTAFKAPVTVQQVTPNTSELTACDALYSAATEAKACFAYEAYFKSCESHALAPIAEGYIEKFCQVQKTTQIEPQPTKTCSQDAKQCGDEQICSLATKNGRWDTSSVNQFYVQEAKKRGLDCKVKAVTARGCSNAAPQKCTPLALCNAANAGGSGTSIYKKEVQKRGLSCRSKPIVERVCSVQTAQVCTKEEICERLSAIRPRYSSHQAYAREAEKRGLTCGVKAQVKKTCTASTPEVCTSTTLCYYAANQSTDEWVVSYELQGYVKEAKKRGLTCGVGQVNTFNFKQAFLSQPKLKRQQLQYALKKLGYYSYGVDGLWGKGTASGFDKFINGNGLKGKTEAQVFKNLLSRIKAPSSFGCQADKKICNFSNTYLCSKATGENAERKYWIANTYAESYVKEAKRRGLSCGVGSKVQKKGPVKEKNTNSITRNKCFA